ncbi:hypothetical protein [Nocardia xishanensis]
MLADADVGGVAAVHYEDESIGIAAAAKLDSDNMDGCSAGGSVQHVTGGDFAGVESADDEQAPRPVMSKMSATVKSTWFVADP